MAITAISGPYSLAPAQTRGAKGPQKITAEQTQLAADQTAAPTKSTPITNLEAVPTQTEVTEPVDADHHASKHGPVGKEKTYNRAHGVLRLLEAGHFNSTAEARLRANFADLLPTPAEPIEQPGDETHDESGTDPTVEPVRPNDTDTPSTITPQVEQPATNAAPTLEVPVIDPNAIDVTLDPQTTRTALVAAFDSLVNQTLTQTPLLTEIA